MDACEQLVLAATRVASGSPTPSEFLRRLGEDAAGIRPGVLGLLDLARGGRNSHAGHGMRGHLDDGSDGQVRHFAGIAAAAGRFSPRLVLWLSVHVGQDAPDSADGRLSALAVLFARDLRRGELHPSDAADWVSRFLCD